MLYASSLLLTKNKLISSYCLLKLIKTSQYQRSPSYEKKKTYQNVSAYLLFSYFSKKIFSQFCSYKVIYFYNLFFTSMTNKEVLYKIWNWCTSGLKILFNVKDIKLTKTASWNASQSATIDWKNSGIRKRSQIGSHLYILPSQLAFEK